jgi:hypothetical protein
MARYFLHIRDRNGYAFDDVGCELPGLDAVRRRALEAARSLIADDVQCGLIDLVGAIEVTDEMGEQVLVLRFADSVRIRSASSPLDPLASLEF